jgi:hypothetical protein
MGDKEIARRILEVADKKLGSVLVGDLPQADIERALQQGWLTPVGVGHFEITDHGRSAAS